MSIKDLKVFETVLGGKEVSGAYQQIINQIRPHSVYMELFLRNGAVFRYKKKASVNYLNDIDATVMSKWQKHTIDGVYYSCVDAIEFLKTFKFDKKLRYVIYLDPPYPHSTRKSRHSRLFTFSVKKPGMLSTVVSQ